jgi:hypothetical protein
VKIEAEEDGDCDSNCSTAEAGELFASVLESARNRREVVVLEDDDDILCDTPHNMIEIKRGLAPEVKVPADWVPDRVKLECTEPASFLVVDNPRGWGQYTFCLKFHNKAKGKDIKKGQYSHHVLLTGARPVPAEDEGKREKAGWAFHYKGWSNHEKANFRSGASYKNPFPATQKGNLDSLLLKHMGLTKARLEKHDALLFFQLLFLFVIRLNPVSPMTQGCISTQKWRTGRRSMLLLWELVGLMGMSTSK